MKRRLVTTLALSGLLFASVPHANVLAATDTTVPKFESIKVDKKEVTGGDNVKVTVKASDNSGIDTIFVSYKYENTDDGGYLELHYNADSQEFEGLLPINGRSMNLNGNFSVYYILITDKAGNTVKVWNTGVRVYPSPYETVVTDLNAGNITVSGNDIKAPEYTSLSIDKKEARTGDKIRISLEASDKESGVDYATIRFLNMDSYVTSEDIKLEYHNESNKYEGYLIVNKDLAGGRWIVDELSIFDKNKNPLYLHNKETQVEDPDAISFSSADFNIVDETPPEVKGVEDNGSYNTDVTPVFSERDAYLNGSSFYSGTKIIKEGTYKLVVVDKFGNKTIINFTIDKTAPKITGVYPDWSYNKDIIPSYEEEDATLNGEKYVKGTPISKEGKYVLEVTDKAGNKKSLSFTIDKTTPVISGVEDNAFYREDVAPTFNEGTANITFRNYDTDEYDYREFKNGDKLTKDGSYELYVYDAADNITRVNFVIGKNYPIMSGLENNGKYKDYVTPVFYDGKATLNGKPFANGTSISDEGSYVLVLKDYKGEITNYNFTIDRTPPVIKGVSDNEVYSESVTPTFNEGEATLNGKTFKNGTTITENGDYTLIVTDNTGNQKSVTFKINKPATPTTPIVPTANDINSTSTSIVGKADANVNITVKNGSKIIGSSTTDTLGNYKVSIPKQASGTKLSITATNSFNKTSNPKEIVVKDGTKPTISSIPHDFIAINSKFDPKVGVTAKDDVDGDVTKNIKVSGDLNIHKVGWYTLTYSVSDKAGNTEVVSVKINVFDEQRPLISGADDKKIPLNSTFNPMSGVTATDNGDGDVTKLIKVTGSVNTKVSGTYTLTYFVSDKAGNESKVTRKITVLPVDTIKPSIAGAANKVVTMNTAFDPKAGVTARDNIDGDLTKGIKVTGSVNTKVKGTYTLTYTVTDKAGNTASVARKITVLDNVLPIIKGAVNKTVSINSKFDSKAGVTATDNIDGDLTKMIKVSGTVNTKVKGTYTLTYTVSDKAGNTAAVVRKVTVADLTKPVITGAANKTIPLNSKFDLKAGVTARDDVDGNITKLLKISGTVNTKVKGTYSITYTVKDKAGNTSSVIRKITVVDNIKPVIPGVGNKTIKLNSKFDSKAGVTAKDNVDGDLTKSIQISGTVNTKKKGTYTITYSVADKSGNKTTTARKVIVN